MRSVLILIALVAGSHGNLLVAEEPLALETGAILLSGSHSVLRGTAREEFTEIVVTQPGGEIRLAREQVLCWSKDMAGLYQYQVDHRPRHEISEYLRLAKWCLYYDYTPGAINELASATLMDPKHRELPELRKQLKDALTRTAKGQKSETPSTVVQASATFDKGTQTLLSAQTSTFERIDPKEVPSAALVEFATTIQPLLSNRCGAAACHDVGGPAAFQFEATPPGGNRPSAAVTRENLAHVLKWIDRRQPETSPILVRSTSAHGGKEQAPLQNRDQQSLHSLKSWVYLVSRGTAHQQSNLELASSHASAGSAGGNSASSMPVRLPSLDDPFDPNVFNRKVHPERASEE